VDQLLLGDHPVRRVGFGAMQLAGPGVFGPPADRDAAIALLRSAVEAGVNHIDTAQYYGPDVVNELIRDALHPYPTDLALVSKVAARRDQSGAVLRYDEPHELRQGIEDNLRTLDVDHLAVVNLRLMDASSPDARFDEQLTAMIKARDDGLIGAVGLSNISVAHLARALEVTEIACVQNSFNLVDRRSMPVLEACQAHGIAFVPFCPLGYPRAQHDQILSDPVVVDIAVRIDATPAQIALAWLLRLSPNTLLIAGTSSPAHLAENLAAADLTLDDLEMARLSKLYV
jgi:pyridoxine 4-dehydrogenase